MVSRLPLRRVASFGGLQFFSAIVPFVVLPVVVELIGTEGWVGLSIGYAVGAALAVGVNFGWATLGPAAVAALEPRQARARFHDSLVQRLVVLGPLLVIASACTAALATPGYRGLALLMLCAVGSAGLASGWYYIGRGEPSGILRYEAVPRLVSTLLSIPLVYLTGSALWYPASLLAGTLWGVAASCRRILKADRGTGLGWRHGLRDHGAIATSNVVGAGYTSLAVPIAQVSGATLADVGIFAGSVRLRTMAVTAPASLTSALQGWVAEPTTEAGRRARMMRAAVATTAVGLVTALGFALLGPWLSSVVLRDAAPLSPMIAVLTGVACLLQALGGTLSFHLLVPMGRGRVIATSRVVASIVGGPIVWVMARQWGALGAVTAVALAELIVTAILAGAVFRHWGQPIRY